MKKESYILRIGQDIWKRKHSILLFQFLGDLLHAVQPYVYLVFPAWILDELAGSKRLGQIGWLVGVGVLLNAVMRLLLGWLDNINMENADACDMQEKNSITEKLMRVPFSFLENGTYAGNVARHRGETTVRGGVFCQCLAFWESIVTAVFRVTAAIAALWPFWLGFFMTTGSGFIGSGWFSMCVIAGAFCACVALILFKNWINRGSRRLRDQYADLERIYEYYRDEISRYQTGKEIRIFRMQDFIKKEATQKLLDQGIRMQRKIAGREVLGEGTGVILFAVLNFCCYLLVGVKALSGLFSLGDIVIYVGALASLLDALRTLSAELGTVGDLRPRAKLYYTIMDVPEEDTIGGKAVNGVSHTLEVKNLSFQYGENPPVLQDISLTLRPGEKVAVVGKNGSGKTTLVKLLCGLYQPTAGEILLDGQNIQHYAVEEYRKLFAMVFQDYKLYSLPVGENVAVAEAYEQGEVERLLEQVGFPQRYGLHTVLYQDRDPAGVEISGGEGQKLALARALYRREAAFVILDEPTSAMDPFSEMELYTKFDGLVKGKAAIYISHRLSSCRFCDRILVLSEGKLVQCGTHEELVEDQNGKYYELWNAQAKYFWAPGFSR